jgi:hypothetical protein
VAALQLRVGALMEPQPNLRLEATLIIVLVVTAIVALWTLSGA